MRRGPDDHGNWNVRASDTASNVIDTGIPGDAPEGGKHNYEDTSVVTDNLYPPNYQSGNPYYQGYPPFPNQNYMIPGQPPF